MNVFVPFLSQNHIPQHSKTQLSHVRLETQAHHLLNMASYSLTYNYYNVPVGEAVM
jgi:hypothetical protein